MKPCAQNYFPLWIEDEPNVEEALFPAEHSVCPHDVYDRWIEKYGRNLDTFWSVADTAIGRLGIMMADEGSYPENARALALNGAEVVYRASYPHPATGNEIFVVQGREGCLAMAGRKQPVVPRNEESQGSPSEFRRMHAGAACGTEGNQVLLGIVAGLAAKFLVMLTSCRMLGISSHLGAAPSFSIPAIQRRNDKRLAIHAKSDASEKARVQNLVNRFPVVRSSIGDAAEFSALCQIHLAPASVS